MEIGQLLKYYRALHNLTQSEVAELAGINEKYLGRIERDESVPTIDKIEQLCHAFDIRLSDFLMISPDRLSLNEMGDSSADPLFQVDSVYYCNCCGCSFREEEAKIIDGDVRCPECGCRYDEDNEFVEKNDLYLLKQ